MTGDEVVIDFGSWATPATVIGETPRGVRVRLDTGGCLTVPSVMVRYDDLKLTPEDTLDDAAYSHAADTDRL